MVGLESPLRLGVFSRASFAIQPRPKSKVYRGEGGTQKCTTSQTESLLPQPSVQDMKTKGAPRHPLTLHTLRRQRRTRHAHGRPSCCPQALRPANFNVAAYRNRSLLQPPPRSGVCSPSCILRKRLWHAPWLRVMRWSPPPRVCCTSPYAAPFRRRSLSRATSPSSPLPTCRPRACARSLSPHELSYTPARAALRRGPFKKKRRPLAS